ncbi:DUF2992 family protein [Kitasatospora sp. NPDC001132]
MPSTFTVFFEGPFWVGVLEIAGPRGVRAARSTALLPSAVPPKPCSNGGPPLNGRPRSDTGVGDCPISPSCQSYWSNIGKRPDLIVGELPERKPVFRHRGPG